MQSKNCIYTNIFLNLQYTDEEAECLQHGSYYRQAVTKYRGISYAQWVVYHTFGKLKHFLGLLLHATDIIQILYQIKILPFP